MLIIFVVVLGFIAVVLLSSSNEKINKESIKEYDINGFDKITRRDKIGKYREDYGEKYRALRSKCRNMKKLHDQKMYSELVASSRAVCETALKQSLLHWGYDNNADFLVLINHAAYAGLISKEEQSKLHSLRMHGNRVMHNDEEVTQKIAFFCYKTAEEIVEKLFGFYTNE